MTLTGIPWFMVTYLNIRECFCKRELSVILHLWTQSNRVSSSIARVQPAKAVTIEPDLEAVRLDA